MTVEADVIRECHRPACRCTHTEPCDRGWLELPPITRNGIAYERVAACPICRPEAAARRDAAAAATKERKAPYVEPRRSLV